MGFVILLVISLCSCKGEKWMGFVYPDKNDLSIHKIIGEYKSLNECLTSANAEAGTRGSSECGLNCEQNYEYGMFVCKETVGNEK